MRKYDCYAVFGHPVAHSLSPLIHTLFAEQTGAAIRYEAIDAPVNDFARTVADFIHGGGRGANVTLPFKEQAAQLTKNTSVRVRIANAANTLVISRGQSIFAENTDGIGLLSDLKRLGLPLKHRLLIIGAGGACRGILHDLLQAQPLSITIANRTPQRAEKIAAEFSVYGTVNAIGFADLDGLTFDCIINATATSLSNTVPDLPGSVAASALWGYDLAYTDVQRCQTAFTRWLNARGVSETHDGLGMLVHQAVESFALWRQVRPAAAPVIAALRR